jgi:ElaB/YqjD/DUF883 family membrane-anchored ribosome-binding protein
VRWQSASSGKRQVKQAQQDGSSPMVVIRIPTRARLLTASFVPGGMMNTEPTTNQGTFDGTKEALVKDLKSVVVDADGLLKEVAHSTTDQLAAARTRIEARLSEARSGLHDAQLAVTQKARNAAGATNEYVRDNPWRLLAVAAAAGVLIGFFLNRR